MQIGEFVEQGFRPGASGKDAPDRRQREGAEADGTLQGLAHIVALILGHQRQELLGLQLALDLFGEQAVEELHGNRAEFAEALTQEQHALGGIGGGLMALERLSRALRGAWQQRMPGDLLKADRVDDDFALGDAHGQHLADM